MWIHVTRNALAPIMTFLGPTLIEMFAGLLIVENLYAFPGFGREYWAAVLALDYPMILGVTLVYAAGFVFVNVLIEILSELLDPRLRSSKQPGVPW
jgi:oligopeptide transport system permease protein